jgi:hypothetical protein
MLGRTVASSKKNSLAGRFSKRLTVTWGSFCAWTKRAGRRRAARKLALISIRVPRWAKQRRDNRVHCEEDSKVGHVLVNASSECIPSDTYTWHMTLLGSVHDNIQERSRQRLYRTLNKRHSTVLPYSARHYPHLDHLITEDNHHPNDH